MVWSGHPPKALGGCPTIPKSSEELVSCPLKSLRGGVWPSPKALGGYLPSLKGFEREVGLPPKAFESYWPIISSRLLGWQTTLEMSWRGGRATPKGISWVIGLTTDSCFRGGLCPPKAFGGCFFDLLQGVLRVMDHPSMLFEVGWTTPQGFWGWLSRLLLRLFGSGLPPPQGLRGLQDHL